jgi:thioredoxin-related protein
MGLSPLDSGAYLIPILRRDRNGKNCKTEQKGQEPPTHYLPSPSIAEQRNRAYTCRKANIRRLMMLSRRAVLSGIATTALGGTLPRRAVAEAILTEDGLYRQPWFLESFLELGPDLDEAAEKSKRFAVMWELKGCPYCKETHLVNFAKPEIETFVKERFEILQLNIIGSREVTDFDGEKLSEKRMAEKYGIRFTPTFQFFPERSAGLENKKPRDREVARAQGYLQPQDFRKLFTFVAEKAYESGTLRDYLRSSN